MKTILLGYKDARGLTEPKTIAGPEVPAAKQVSIVQAAKRTNQYPKGIVRLELVQLIGAAELAIQTKLETNQPTEKPENEIQ